MKNGINNKKYRGKYPNRIRTVYGFNNRVVAITNDYRRFELTAEQCGFNMPNCGQDINLYTGDPNEN